MVTVVQGSAVTQTTFGGIIIYPLVANFWRCTAHAPQITKTAWQKSLQK